MSLVAASPLASGSVEPPDPDLRKFYCAGCGRRLLEYDAIGGAARIRVRCRDCKTVSELRGADVPGLLHAIAEGRGHR
jgi:hypothetical protein